MDSGKDIQKTDYLTKFLDSYTVRTNPFGRNVSGERAYRRAERLVAAVHILTNHISIEEPSRVEIRRIGIGLLTSILALRDEMRVSVSPVFYAVQSGVRELISLIRVLSISGYVSPQNASTVVEALDELGNFLIVSQRSTLSESIVFSKDDLLGVQDLPRVPMGEIPVKDSVPRRPNTAPQGVKDRGIIKDIYRTKDIGQKISEDINVRAQAVLAILKSQGTLGIRDISSNLPEYSEKMIQRELARLIILGRVKKTGFKRWSRYEFAR